MGMGMGNLFFIWVGSVWVRGFGYYLGNCLIFFRASRAIANQYPPMIMIMISIDYDYE
jgi:hypothetical protein